jgi:FMN phosphatase YigB (HAD superfamily)
MKVCTMIKALIFDLGRTLVGFDFKRGYAAMEGRCRFPAAEIPKQIGTTDLVVRLESGRIGAREFVQELCGLLELNMSYEEFCQVWFSIFLPGTLVDEEWLERLGRRYPLVLLSNTNSIHFEMLEANYPILRLFERRVLSHEVGAMKPSPIIYEAAVRKAGCRPSECFFTDDVPAYVEGACQCGIDAVRFHSQEHLERELRARGVEW